MEPSNPTPEHHPLTSQSPAAAEPPIEQQTVREWLTRNGSTLVFVAVIVALMYQWLGLEGLGTAALVAIGLGMVIFIHELGHFLVAKWCDVHVETFSIGFGPPLPGCKFQRGETTYMVALFPLGGYVKMVGEGAENEEEDNDPRSFKNKAVWQRMAIISAGVFMNMVLGIGCFIFVYMTHGVERVPGVIGKVDAGSPAWQEGAMTGALIYRIGHVSDPYFEQLKPVVALSSKGQKLDFVFGQPGQPKTVTVIEPRKADGQPPLIGIAPPPCLKLLPAQAKKSRDLPVLYGSAAAAAEPAFEWADEIVATTDPDHNGAVTPLKNDPRNPEQAQPDYFEYHRRIERMVGKEFKVRVRRAAADPNTPSREVEIAIPPAYHSTLGLRMKMGKIVAIRNDSPAAKAGVQISEPKSDGDEIIGVTAIYPDGRRLAWGQPKQSPEGGKPLDLDPMRLPWELIRKGDPKEVQLTVLRLSKEQHKPVPVELALDWDNRFRFDDEVPIGANSPLAIPQLGLAYTVETTVDGVVPGSPAAKTRAETGEAIEKGDVIEAVCHYLPPEKGKAVRPQKRLRHFFFEEEDWTKLEPGGWALVGYYFPHQEIKQLDLRVKRGDQTFRVHLQGVDDKDWPMASRGLILASDFRMHKAQNLIEAISLGFDRAFQFIKTIYGSLQALLTGRVPINSVTGPIGIAATAYKVAGMDIYSLILFLGIISVNLAVVNFLPIPVLDGGHMVFLVYEGLRGKPASETVRIGATYVGLALIGCLMLFVICIDVGRYFW